MRRAARSGRPLSAYHGGTCEAAPCSGRDEGRVSVGRQWMSMGRRFLRRFVSRRRDWFLDFHVGFRERWGLPNECHQLPRFLGRVLLLPRGHTSPSDAVLNDVEKRPVATTLNLSGSQVGHLRVHVGAISVWPFASRPWHTAQ